MRCVGLTGQSIGASSQKLKVLQQLDELAAKNLNSPSFLVRLENWRVPIPDGTSRMPNTLRITTFMIGAYLESAATYSIIIGVFMRTLILECVFVCASSIVALSAFFHSQIHAISPQFERASLNRTKLVYEIGEKRLAMQPRPVTCD